MAVVIRARKNVLKASSAPCNKSASSVRSMKGLCSDIRILRLAMHVSAYGDVLRMSKSSWTVFKEKSTSRDFRKEDDASFANSYTLRVPSDEPRHLSTKFPTYIFLCLRGRGRWPPCTLSKVSFHSVWREVSDDSWRFAVNGSSETREELYSANREARGTNPRNRGARVSSRGCRDAAEEIAKNAAPRQDGGRQRQRTRVHVRSPASMCRETSWIETDRGKDREEKRIPYSMCTRHTIRSTGARVLTRIRPRTLAPYDALTHSVVKPPVHPPDKRIPPVITMINCMHRHGSSPCEFHGKWSS